jgi:hypothetical protein
MVRRIAVGTAIEDLLIAGYLTSLGVSIRGSAANFVMSHGK